jgi:membrane-bound lytic murein transglycosylase F
VDRGGYRERAASEYLASETGRLSEWDDVILRNATAIGWDWRLLASQVYQESLFDPRARSWAGAMGLLQLMPATAREMGVDDPYDPEQNVAGGARYLQWLENQWTSGVPDPEQRLRFILASYNVGRGHVQDAQRLAEKNGNDPLRWEHVSHWLLQKSKRDVFSDPVVRYGYARGLEPVTYVSKILDRYRHYQQFVHERPDIGDDGA